MKLFGFRKLSKRAAGATQKPQAAVGGLSIGYAGTRISSLYFGTVTLVAGLATVSGSNADPTAMSSIAANSLILLDRQVSGGTVGVFYEITARTNATSFAITSRSAAGTTA